MTEFQRERLIEAKSELACALTQALPSDDQILCDHMKIARDILQDLLDRDKAHQEFIGVETPCNS